MVAVQQTLHNLIIVVSLPTHNRENKGQVNLHPNKAASTSAPPQCFQIGEMGHRMVDCRKGGCYGKGLLIDKEESGDYDLVKIEQGHNDKKECEEEYE